MKFNINEARARMVKFNVGDVVKVDHSGDKYACEKGIVTKTSESLTGWPCYLVHLPSFNKDVWMFLGELDLI
jgi:hypothetical protein